MSGADERRRNPRFELYASVEIDGGDEVLILTVRNLSITGLLVASDGHDLGQFTVGNTYRLGVFDPANERYQIDVSARVVRRQVSEMALTWDDEAVLFRMQSMIERLGRR